MRLLFYTTLLALTFGIFGTFYGTIMLSKYEAVKKELAQMPHSNTCEPQVIIREVPKEVPVANWEDFPAQ